MSGTVRLEEAAAAYREVLMEFEAGGANHYPAMAKANIDEVERLIADRSAG